MSRYASAALIIMYACTGQHHDSAALHHRAMEWSQRRWSVAVERPFYKPGNWLDSA
ncbi:hypothetical protein UY416_24445 [Paenibacillus polymyxa]|uniref:hypothetical protein n=1 Tax=Paenibacillus polymyxa TaxID=1406 RepID=UPI002AB429A5|nr:hypothetical protein [Paenibacillus polymyxa]MDY8049447.1 hypothetical protein [Paenibacillus polymyxa]